MKFLAKNYFLSSILVVFMLHFILEKGFGVQNSWVRFGFATAALILLMPRRKKIQTQSGEKIQLTWIFLKEPITID